MRKRYSLWWPPGTKAAKNEVSLYLLMKAISWQHSYCAYLTDVKAMDAVTLRLVTRTQAKTVDWFESYYPSSRVISKPSSRYENPWVLEVTQYPLTLRPSSRRKTHPSFKLLYQSQPPRSLKPSLTYAIHPVIAPGRHGTQERSPPRWYFLLYSTLQRTHSSSPSPTAVGCVSTQSPPFFSRSDLSF